MNIISEYIYCSTIGYLGFSDMLQWGKYFPYYVYYHYYDDDYTNTTKPPPWSNWKPASSGQSFFFLSSNYPTSTHPLSNLHRNIRFLRIYTAHTLHPHAWNINRVLGTAICSACWSINIYIAEEQIVCATIKQCNRSRDH